MNRYYDSFKPRPFQRDLIEVLVSRVHQGESVTVGLAGPGTGKTLGYQAGGIELLRQGLADYIAAFAPRTSLAQQCELEYAKQRDWFDPRARFSKITHRVNSLPLTEGERTGYVSTYTALCTASHLHHEWARAHHGRFLLVVDEAQFCGCDDPERETTGTVAAHNIEMLSQYAKHTLVLTGSPYRSDNAQIVLAQYEPADKPGHKQIIAHAKATYLDGINEGYLRKFDAQFIDAAVTRRGVISEVATTEQLSVDARMLGQVLRCDDVWQPLVDRTVYELKDVQRLWCKYKALIGCMTIDEAKKVVQYLRARFPEMTVKSALHDDKTAHHTLRQFKVDDTDILVTVRMVYVGYDCKRITVIGFLTNYRHDGHLEQFAGRGLRVDDDSGISPERQRCRFIVPDDPEMKKFITYLRNQIPKTIPPPGPEGPGQPEPSEYVDSALANSVSGAALDSDFTPAEVAQADRFRKQFNISGSIGDIIKLIRQGPQGWDTPAPGNPATPTNEGVRSTTGADDLRTEAEQVRDLRSAAFDDVKKAASSCGIIKGDPDYGERFSRFMKKHVLQPFNIASARNVTTVEQARRYADFCRALANRMSAGGEE